MKVQLHKIKGQTGTAIYLPQKSKIKVKQYKKGHIMLKIPYMATTQNRLLVYREGERVEAYID